jgi:hypothetical protein
MREALLVALVPGVGREDLTLGGTPFLGERIASDQGVARLHHPLGKYPLDELFGPDLVATLHRDGLTVDRRTWLLRPKWQGDDAALRMLESTDHPRAAVTFLYLTDVAHAAIQHGPGSAGHRAALARLEDHVVKAQSLLRRFGEPAELVLLAFGAYQAVDRCFDPCGALRNDLRRLSWWSSGRPALELAPQRLRIVCKSWEQVRYLAARLTEEPFCNHGRLLGTAEAVALGLGLPPAELWLLPLRGVAFGRAGQRGVARHLCCAPGDSGCAVLPWLETSVHDLELAEARRGLLAHARTLSRRLADVQPPLPEPRVAARRSHSLTDVEAVFQHDRLEEVEDAAHVAPLLGVRPGEE